MIAVVGAGVAGLAAARALADEGVPVRVLDKGRRPGGRASTRRRDGVEIDHGAQYFTARDPEFRRRVDDWASRGVVARWEPRIAVLGGTADPEDDRERWVGVPGMDAIAHDLADGLDVASGTAVAAIERDGRSWRLADGGGATLARAHAVIVTAPAPQTARLVATAAPALAAAAADVRFAPCWAVLAELDAPAPVAFDAAFVKGSALSWAARNASKPGRPPGETWVLHGAPDWSRAHLEDDPGSVPEALLDAFVAASGARLAPVRVRAHRWRYALAEPPLEEGCRADAGRGIAVAGDWLAGSRVEGAWRSGMAAARALGPGRAR